MRVTFFFDPLCPWAWISSRWLLEAARVREIEPVFDLMSQTYLYEGQDLTEEQRATVRDMIKPLRVLAATEQEHGAEALPRLYERLGVRFHDEGLRHRPEVWSRILADSLRAAGFDAGLAAAAETDSHDARIRRTHDTAVAAAGPEAGTPVIRLDEVGGAAFFGPVVSPAPRGEPAGRLWDGVLLLAATPGFYELKRSRMGGPVFE
ncbi:disulfide bond formation protein DsbA [Plantactinospora sp. GCM10030261]|uniref:mycothiol-dependent nitroreductase Rv2466c family protein n=1 Tax=Plantactinospora sp. GCM10030261 TaxID=3273420 RepID=UPI003619AA7B